jgi:hypothetical protein
VKESPAAKMSVLERIADIENEMARTQRNKATAHHLGILKAKLAKLRRELITPKSSGGPAGEGFDVAKTGDARIGFVGFPSVSGGEGDQGPICRTFFSAENHFPRKILWNFLEKRFFENFSAEKSDFSQHFLGENFPLNIPPKNEKSAPIG